MTRPACWGLKMSKNLAWSQGYGPLKKSCKLDRVVDRVYGSWFMVLFKVWFMVWFIVWFMVSIVMFFLDIVDYPVFSLRCPPCLNTIVTLCGTWGFYRNHVLPLRPFKTVYDNFLLDGLVNKSLNLFTSYTSLFHPRGILSNCLDGLGLTKIGY